MNGAINDRGARYGRVIDETRRGRTQEKGKNPGVGDRECRVPP